MGTPLQLTDSQGKTHWSARYKAWGRVLRYEVKEVEQPLRFQGQYEDAETGLYYNRHRYYDPDQARYITPDPIGLLGGINLYQYAPNPLSWIDPVGLAKTKGGCDPCCGKDLVSEAKSKQNAWPYAQQDQYKQMVLKKGTVLVTLYPHGQYTPGFFSDPKTLAAAGGSARRYNDMVQVAHDRNVNFPPQSPMRTQIRRFVVQEDICVATGKASANDRLGDGGGTQYYVSIPDRANLTPARISTFSRR